MSYIPQNPTEICQSTDKTSTCQTGTVLFLQLLYQTFISTKPTKPPPEKTRPNKFDFIIVGGGSAGCVVASRLTEIQGWNVLLLEAGIEQPDITNVPPLLFSFQKSNVDWDFKTQPEKTSCIINKGCTWPRGKMMGGSGSLNGMLYVRGNAKDYDNWEKLGNTGWSYKNVLKYFIKSEDNRDKEIVQQNPGYHGTGGNQSVQRFPYEDINAKNILKALTELGYKNLDVNGKEQLGAMFSQATSKDGQRQSTNSAFIQPIRNKRSNLFIETEAYVTKIIFNTTTKAAIGVEYTSTVNNLKTKKVAYATKEVISSAGVVNSPKLLMLSGIGPAEDLQKLNIKVIKNSPVGKNLHDHVTFSGVSMRLSNKTITDKSLEQKKADLKQYLESHTGPLSSTGTAVLNLLLQTKYEKTAGLADGQFLFIGVNTGEAGNPRVLSYYNTVTNYPLLLAPESRGYLKLNQTDPTWGPPLIYPGYFKDNSDVLRMIEIIRKSLELFKTKTFIENGYKLIDTPQAPCNHLKFNTDDYWVCMIRNNTVSGSHQVGSCKMGPKNDSGAVVDPRLKVYGVTGLRVIDAAVMSVIPRANIYVPIIMIAEKAADMIKEDWPTKGK